MAVCAAMAYVGADGLDDCPAEPMVPKYLMGESKDNTIHKLEKVSNSNDPYDIQKIKKSKGSKIQKIDPKRSKNTTVAGMLFIALAASAVTASVAFFACTRVVDSAIPLKWRDPVRGIIRSTCYIPSIAPQRFHEI